MPKARNQGFTLIELLASIVIITIILTVFMKFFSQAIMFANQNEETLTASNDAREVLSLLQENHRSIDVLKSITENGGIYNPDGTVKANTVITNTDTLKKLLNPWNEMSGLVVEDIKLSLKDGPNNLVEVKVEVMTPDDSKVLSETYGYVPKKRTNTIFNLSELPSSSANGKLNIWTGLTEETIFIEPDTYDIAFQMKNSNHNRFSSITFTEDGDSSYYSIKKEIDEYTIKGTLLFRSPHNNGGFGILVDGSLTKPTDTIKSQTVYLNENGFMVSVIPKDNQVHLSLRKDGKEDTSWIKITKQITMQIGTSINWQLPVQVEIKAQNAYSINSSLDPLSTVRVYTLVLAQGSTVKTQPLVFQSDTINLTKIPSYDYYSKYIGLRLWSNSSTSFNEIKIFR